MDNWQDYVLALGSIIFALALVPSIISKNKPAIATSLTTSLVLFVFAVTYFTLSLWFSALAVTINGLAWLVLAIQKYNQRVN